MSFAFSIRPEAEADLVEARDWYEAHRDGLGMEFLSAVDDVFERIGDSPESYPIIYTRRPVGSSPSVSVPVYYRIKEGGVQVLAVLHGSRHPRVWRSRL
jgi:toxin ParE1/3/4